MKASIFILCLALLASVRPDSRKFKLALWHEAVVGAALTDPKVMKDYLTSMANFVKLRKIDRVMIHLQDPMIFKGHSLENYVYFLSLLPDVELGIEYYLTPSDGIWSYKPEIAGGLNCNNNNYTVKPPKGGCKNRKVPYENEACPNNLEQMFQFIEDVNNAAAKKGIKNSYKSAAVDGEAMGDYTHDLKGFCQVLQAAKQYAPSTGIDKSKDVGIALGPKTNPSTTGTAAGYPELYWIGEKGKVIDVSQDDVRNTAYTKFLNNPQGLLNYLDPLYKSFKPAWSTGTWPMFSTEVKNTGFKCVQTQWASSGNGFCGTFNGFGLWNWESFEKFMELFSEKYHVDRIAIYEWQFIPTSWLSSSLTFLEGVK